jgi:hypothetical protein
MILLQTQLGIGEDMKNIGLKAVICCENGSWCSTPKEEQEGTTK